MPSISEPTLGRNGNLAAPPTTMAAREEVLEQTRRVVDLAVEHAAEGTTFIDFERALAAEVFALARAVIGLFLTASEERVRASLTSRVIRGGRVFRSAPAQPRNLLTSFGLIRYTRLYLREVVPKGARARGFHPLDAALGLFSDRVSPNVLAMAARLATRMSFVEAREVLSWFFPMVPSTEVIEAAVLGYGRYTRDWFTDAPAPEGDGDVLIIHIDSKGVPTATDDEMAKRRGPRSQRTKAPSPRHRGRDVRDGWTKKPRRGKGDKAKNAKMGTMVVMYTLRSQWVDGRLLLLGPINKRVYASFATKRHAVEYARAEATKRGFGPRTRRLVQVLTDGDPDLALYVVELFPGAIHTLDVMHAVEKLWDAGAALYGEGTEARTEWVEAQKQDLYGGRPERIVVELDTKLTRMPKTGPGARNRRKALTDVRDYINKRIAQMDYGELIDRDLEISTGPVEGAIKNIMCNRMDHGGMRWLKDRAEAVLQLRCIDVNGDWEVFTRRVHDQARALAMEKGERVRLQQRQPAGLPEAGREAA